jgi:hypothetical protein
VVGVDLAVVGELVELLVEDLVDAGDRELVRASCGERI